MSANPLSASMLALSAASTGLGLIGSKRQEKLDIATIRAESESAKNQAAQQALASSQGFRQALASQLAISSLRGSGGSISRQFASQSISNMLGDSRAFEQQQKSIDLGAGIQKAQAKSNKFTRNVNSIGGLLGAGVQSVNLSALSGGE